MFIVYEINFEVETQLQTNYKLVTIYSLFNNFYPYFYSYKVYNQVGKWLTK